MRALPGCCVCAPHQVLCPAEGTWWEQERARMSPGAQLTLHCVVAVQTLSGCTLEGLSKYFGWDSSALAALGAPTSTQK